MKHYKILSSLLRYPDEEFRNLMIKTDDLIEAVYPELKTGFAKFFDTCLGMNLKELEELYVRTFDVQAICYLDIGYILFGEDYKRGAFLVKMNEEQKKCGVDCRNELADHLPNILEMITVHPDSAFISEFVREILYPAVVKMIEAFKDSQNPYKYLLQTVRFILQKDFITDEVKRYEPIQNTFGHDDCMQCHCNI